MSETILRMSEVLRRTGRGRTATYEAIAAGTFPAPIRLGARAVGFLESEINEWVAARIAERDGAKGERGRSDGAPA